MRKSFYASLAMQNMKKNYRTVIPYILACMGMIMMQYIVVSITFSEMLNTGSLVEVTMKFILLVGIVVVSLFSIIFIFYTNSFLMKRRTKEIGLFNILGMEKKHINKVMFYETLYTAIISIGCGILLGILFSKLVQLGLLKIVQLGPTLGMEISSTAIITCIILYGVIFLCTYFNNILKIQMMKPVELLTSGNVGEKEPKTKILIGILGVICLGMGYWLSQSAKSPLEALALFFIAVFFVIIGTYCLFISVSIFILKLLRKNKKFYYKTNNFTAISGMIYRMKQNAVGLANICILSTCVLVMISTTVSLYMGIEDSLHLRYPRDIEIKIDVNEDGDKDYADEFIKNILVETEIDISNEIKYRDVYINGYKNEDTITFEDVYEKNENNVVGIKFIYLDDYNEMSGSNYELMDDELLIFRGKSPERYDYDTLTLGDKKYKVVESLDEFFMPTELDVYILDSNYIVANNPKEVLNQVKGIDPTFLNYSYYYKFDTSISPEKQIEFVDEVNTRLVEDVRADGYCDGVESSRGSFMTMYGTLLFIGVFLGILFTMATSLIIYYKQISEGYEDVTRYNIMQKVGMSKQEVQLSIKRQILMVFFLPLGVAIIHIAFSFNIISKLLVTLQFSNIPLFIMCMIGTTVIFSIFYLIVYIITSRLYYRIVRMK